MPACRLNSPTQSQGLSNGGLAISEALAVPPLEMLFRLEIEFHRRLRSLALGMSADSGLHTSYAIQAGYEQLLQTIGRVSASDIERLGAHLITAGDARDVLAARNSVTQLLGLVRFLEERR